MSDGYLRNGSLTVEQSTNQLKLAVKLAPLINEENSFRERILFENSRRFINLR